MSGVPLRENFKSPFLNKKLLGRAGQPYHASNELLAAADAALVLGAPLLLTGEPGSGKTDFAYVVAHALETMPAEPFACHVRSDTRARDLLYYYDALRRFGDAQHGSDEDKKNAQDPRRYIHLNGLARGLLSPRRQVVLIDEIDKAPRDLPNDLLRELDRERGDFEIPEIDELIEKRIPTPPTHERPLRRIMRRDSDAPMPFIVITSNAERQLPEPFLRRCVFFSIRFPDQEQLLTIVRERNERPTPDGMATEPLLAANLVDPAVKIFQAFRTSFNLSKPPSTAELLCWIEILGTMYDPRALKFELTGFAARLDDTTLRPKGEEKLSWRQLPGLHCLIKSDEDLVRLG